MKSASIQVYFDETHSVPLGVFKQTAAGSVWYRDMKVAPKQWWYSPHLGSGAWSYDKAHNALHLFEDTTDQSDPYAGPSRRTVLTFSLDDHWWVYFPFNVGQSGGGFMHVQGRIVPFGSFPYKVAMVT